MPSASHEGLLNYQNFWFFRIMDIVMVYISGLIHFLLIFEYLVHAYISK